MSHQCQHGLFPATDYCAPCEQAAHENFTTWAARLSHDSTPIIPSHH